MINSTEHIIDIKSIASYVVAVINIIIIQMADYYSDIEWGIKMMSIVVSLLIAVVVLIINVYKLLVQKKKYDIITKDRKDSDRWSEAGDIPE